jgi:hypothetical protein
MSTTTLSNEQELEARQLVSRVHEVMEAEMLQAARLLVGKETRDLFGKTEFDLRDILLRVGAKMYELYLAEKKTGMSAPASSVPTVSKRRSFKVTGPKPR